MDAGAVLRVGGEFSYVAQAIPGRDFPLQKYKNQRITARVNLHGDGVKLEDITPKRSLSARAICVSKTIDIITVTIGVISPIVFAILHYAFRGNHEVISIINYVAIGISALLALGPLKSKILDILKRPE